MPCRTKRSRSREPESDKAKHSRHSRGHQSRDRASPDAGPSRQPSGLEKRPERATTPAPAPSKPKGLVVVKAKQFEGCYSQLVDKLLDTQPRQVRSSDDMQLVSVSFCDAPAMVSSSGSLHVIGESRMYCKVVQQHTYMHALGAPGHSIIVTISQATCKCCPEANAVWLSAIFA